MSLPRAGKCRCEPLLCTYRHSKERRSSHWLHHAAVACEFSAVRDYGRDKLRLIIDQRGTKRNAQIDNHPVVSVVIVFESTVGGA